MRTLRLLLVLLLVLVKQASAQIPANPPLDFDGDGRTDYCVTRLEGNSMIWYIAPSSGAPHYSAQWGVLGDVAVPEDFDGDSRDDVAIWRPTSSSASFFILQSQTSTLRIVPFGLIGDDPSVVADYDGDNRADLAVYRNAAPGGQSYFYFLGSQNNPNNNINYIPWGTSGDFPLVGDYDGDGRADFAVQRSLNGSGVFYRLQSTAGADAVWFGLPTDLVAAGDYDGDRKTDLCVIRPDRKNLRWWIRRSTDGVIVSSLFGRPNLDTPTPGDYDGDGLIDISVWRPNPDPTMCFFHVIRSSTGTASTAEWGIGTDFPAANFKVH